MFPDKDPLKFFVFVEGKINYAGENINHEKFEDKKIFFVKIFSSLNEISSVLK